MTEHRNTKVEEPGGGQQTEKTLSRAPSPGASLQRVACRYCGTPYIARAEYPWALGYCSGQCQNAARVDYLGIEGEW